MSKSKWRTITIMEAMDTQDYSHEEMENLVFVERAALEEKQAQIKELVEVLESVNKNARLLENYQDENWLDKVELVLSGYSKGANGEKS